MSQPASYVQSHVIHNAYWGLRTAGFLHRLGGITGGAGTDFFREGEDTTSPCPASSLLSILSSIVPAKFRCCFPEGELPKRLNSGDGRELKPENDKTKETRKVDARKTIHPERSACCCWGYCYARPIVRWLLASVSRFKTCSYPTPELSHYKGILPSCTLG